MFYINYEECKLTVALNAGSDLALFYINYEECKYLIFSFNILKLICFILTMRNVNKLA